MLVREAEFLAVEKTASAPRSVSERYPFPLLGDDSRNAALNWRTTTAAPGERTAFAARRSLSDTNWPEWCPGRDGDVVDGTGPWTAPGEQKNLLGDGPKHRT